MLQISVCSEVVKLKWRSDISVFKGNEYYHRLALLVYVYKWFLYE